MKARFLSLFLSACLTGAAFARPLPLDGPLPLEDGDLVVFLGDTFLERDGLYGYLEEGLTASFAGKNVRFRNLGWSGDTPRAESRSYFGPPEEGFQRLAAQLKELKPTVIISCYGAVDSFNGAAGHPDFLKAYARLLDMIRDTCGAGVVLMSPPVTQTLPDPFPDMKAHNADVEAMSGAIAGFAKDRGLRFADLFKAMGDAPVPSENGVTFSMAGYRALAPAFLKALAAPAPVAAPPEGLRKLIVEKNDLYFHRWRPQNEIYLFGARKHEQGNNASEVQLFEPLVAEKETAIQTLVRGK